MENLWEELESLVNGVECKCESNCDCVEQYECVDGHCTPVTVKHHIEWDIAKKAPTWDELVQMARSGNIRGILEGIDERIKEDKMHERV